jgi:two-component system response regulator (stage 0 sporulation protein A)
MPELDGVGVLKKLKSTPMKKKPLFIVLSAIGNEKIANQALELGADFYIVKPFDMDMLVDKIHQLQVLNNQISLMF